MNENEHEGPSIETREGYWDDRVRTHGHPGSSNAALHAYDHPLRLAAVIGALEAMTGSRGVPKILDVGCGTGDLAVELGHRGWDVVGIDLSAEATAEATRRTEQFPRVRILTRGVLDYDPGTETFDVVVTMAVLQHLAPDEIVRALARSRQWLVPGGHVVLLETKRALPRRDWLMGFESAGLELAEERRLTQWGSTSVQWLGRARELVRRGAATTHQPRSLMSQSGPLARYVLAATAVLDKQLRVPTPRFVGAATLFVLRRTS